MTTNFRKCALSFALTSLVTCSAGFAAGNRFPKHTFSNTGHLTAPSSEPKQSIAAGYIAKQALAAGLTLQDIAGLRLVKSYFTEHNGVQHFVYRQQFQGIDVWNSDFTVNVDADGSVINSGGQLYAQPSSDLKAPQVDSAIQSLDRALAKLGSNRKGVYEPARSTRDPILRTFRFVKKQSANQSASNDAVTGDPMWYPVNGALRPIWMFYIADDNGVDRYATPVDSVAGFVFPKINLTHTQQARVFDKGSPQPNPTPGVLSTVVRPYVDRTLQPLQGDPKASPNGWVSGNQTAGNNVIAATDPFGVTFNQTSVPVAAGADGNFDFPLSLGPGQPNPALFPGAEVTNLFYWANKAHDSFYSIGFDEQAGSYQTDNFGKGGVDGDPMYAFSQFGSQANGYAALNNAFYTTTNYYEDGSQGSINMYVAGSSAYRLFSDGSYDAEVITHEYTHGVSTRLVHGIDTHQGNSMGEAWSDFFSLEFTIPIGAGAPPDGEYTAAEYLFQTFGIGIRTHPYTTDLKINPLTYAQLGSVTSFPEVHADGEIWVEALWEMRSNLIEQFGESEGRRRVRLLVIDAMKLSPPNPTMVDMRDAILLSDRVDFKGASQNQIWKAFAKRGLGALAYSIDPDSVFIASSFDMPSNAGQVRFYQDAEFVYDQLGIVLQDSNLTGDTAMVQVNSTSGDLEDVLLRRQGSVFFGTIPSSPASTRQRNDYLTAIGGDYVNVYYTDYDTGDGSTAQVYASLFVKQNYTQVLSSSTTRFIGSNERGLFGTYTADNAIRVELPFDFPFYGQKYRRAWISTDGIISFGTPEPFTSPCPSYSVLSSVPSIAPAFVNLMVGLDPNRFVLDPTSDVFISSSTDFVTFHWVAYTQPNQYLISPSAVDFNATLFNDGKILFQYGASNSNLLTDHYWSYAYGCSASGPISGISIGHNDTYLTTYYADGFTNLGSVPSTYWYPPSGNSSVPQAVLETPAAGAAVKDILTVSGVAGDPNTGIVGVDILVDGMMRGTATVSLLRTDFCAKQPQFPRCPFVGFSTDINLSAIPLASGTHTVQAHARNYQGGLTVFPDQPVSFTVDGTASRLPVGAIESPAAGASVAGNVVVKGYVYSPDLRVSNATLLIDGLSYLPLSLSQLRADICTKLTPQPPNCPVIGFQATLNTSSGTVFLPNGSHQMQLRVQDSLGRISILPDAPVNITVNNPDRTPTEGVLESPSLADTLSGIIDVKGFAYAPGGRVTSVSVLVDGSTAGTLTYGGVRADACASLPDVAACPNIGFTGTLDTRRFSNGPHVIGVNIVNSTGASTIVPQLARYGMNVIIQN